MKLSKEAKRVHEMYVKAYAAYHRRGELSFTKGEGPEGAIHRRHVHASHTSNCFGLQKKTLIFKCIPYIQTAVCMSVQKLHPPPPIEDDIYSLFQRSAKVYTSRTLFGFIFAPFAFFILPFNFDFPVIFCLFSIFLHMFLFFSSSFSYFFPQIASADIPPPKVVGLGRLFFNIYTPPYTCRVYLNSVHQRDHRHEARKERKFLPLFFSPLQG